MFDSRVWTLAAVLLSAITGVACHQLDLEPRYKAGEIDLFDDLFAVAVADENHAVAAGYHGAIYWTDDAGETWHKGNSPTTLLLYSLSMADAKNGWAVGQLGLILRTRDGGANWEIQPSSKAADGSNLFGVHAIDANNAWIVGDWGTRIRTRNGGATWEDESLTISMDHPMYVWLSSQDQDNVRRGEAVFEDVGLNDVYCLPKPSKKCWIIGEFGYIFYSDDLGDSWTRGEILGEVRMDPIEFPYNELDLTDENRENLIAFSRRIEDQAHLNVLLDPFASPREIANFGSREDPSELFDIISARIDEVKSVIEEAGVMSDRMRMPNKPPWDWEDFEEADPTFLQRYLDGRLGETPQIKVSVIQNPYLFTIDFEDTDSGYISGLGGVILRTQDSGRTWSYLDTGRKQAFYSVSYGDGRAVAIGEKGLIRYSSDGGNTWESFSESSFPTIFTFMRDLDFAPGGRKGLIVGQGGRILRSVDSGYEWKQVLPALGDPAESEAS